MDGILGPEDKLRSVVVMCAHALENVTWPETNPGRIEFCRRLEELSSAMATVRTRFEVALDLNRVPTSPPDVGTSPMASEAAARLLLAIKNVIAFRDT